MSNENAPQILADLPENLQSLLAKGKINFCAHFLINFNKMYMLYA